MSDHTARLTAAGQGRTSRPPDRGPRWQPRSDSLIPRLTARYGGLPAWVLVVQLFLAVGWLRAAVAHAASASWWSGQEIETFRAAHSGLAIDWYWELILDGLVTLAPGGVAAVVLVSQIVVGLLLAMNRRTMVGLGLGAFLNVNFVLAGAIDPSAFYLVLGASVAMWHVEATLSTARCWWLTFTATVVGFTFVGALAPQIHTLAPAAVIDDPAAVLTFVTVLWVAGLWVVFGRRIVRHNSDPSVSLAGVDVGHNLLAEEATADTDNGDGRQQLLDRGVLNVSNTILILFQAPQLVVDELNPASGAIGTGETGDRGLGNNGGRRDQTEAMPSVLIPESFADAERVADEFKRNLPVLLDLRSVDQDMARRLSNFAMGTCYSLDGRMEKIESRLFLLIPESVELSDEGRRRIEAEMSYAG